MEKPAKLRISVIVPLFKGESTIIKTLESLLAQTIKFDELIIVDDASSDNSRQLTEDFLKNKLDYKTIKHNRNLGLAKSYNEAIKLSEGSLIVTLHQDVILMKDSLEILVASFSDKKVVASSHTVIHPIEIWNKYNFWQKCFFARKTGKDEFGIDGKFDCFRKEALIKVGLFDEARFRSAGEDADIVFRLKEIGKVVNSKAEIIHIHKVYAGFNYTDIIFKQKQYSEAQGVLLRKKEIKNSEEFVKMFFRELLVVLLFAPYTLFFSAFLILVYSFWYTKLVYLKEYKNPRILILPFFNIYLLIVSFVYTLKGFIFKKQTI